MAKINISVKKNYIPFDILGEEYRFYKTDDIAVKFDEEIDGIIGELEKVEKEGKGKFSEQLGEMQEVLGEAFDFIFEGQNVFEKVYKEVQSVNVMVDILEQVLDKVTTDLQKEKEKYSKKKVDQYIKNKKK